MPKIQNFKKINSGSFRNYTHNAVTANLSSYLNIILGWNGSGKTTISRIMRSYELNKLYDNLYQFEIVLDDKSTVTQHDTEKLHQSVKVFNDHYVDSILRDGMSKISYIGEKATEYSDLEIEIKNHNEELNKIDIKEYHKDISENTSNKKIKIIDGIQNIRKPFSGGTFQHYNKSNFIERINDIKGKLSSQILKNVNELILSDNALQLERDSLKNLEKKRYEYDVLQSVSKYISDNIAGLNERLQFVPKFVKSKRVDSMSLTQSNWVEDGLKLHTSDNENKEFCLFCNSQINNYEELLNHFTKDIISLNETIRQYISNFKDLKNDLLKIVSFYNTEKTLLRTKIDEILKLLDEKNSNITSAIDKYSFAFDIPNFTDNLDSIAYKLETHYVALEFDDYVNKESLYNINLLAKNSLEANIKAKRDELIVKKNDALNDKIAPEKINELIKLAFPHRNISIQNSDSNDIGYLLKRNNTVCKLQELSEGEKNFIALLYFITSLNNSSEKLTLGEDGIVVIDDPVSSHDSNTIFQIYSMIASEIENKKNRQYIILTHNLDFFGHLHNRFNSKDKEDLSKIVNFFQVDLTNNGSIISNMNSSLSNYRSDYQYAISKLNEIKDGDCFEDAYIATNLLRRVIETFVTFKYGQGDLKGKLNQLCMDASKSEIQTINKNQSMPEDLKKSKVEAITEKYSQTDKILYSFINYGSHKFSSFTSADDAILQNYKSTIEKFFELVKNADSAHCKYIEKL